MVQKLRHYRVEGFVPRLQLREDELKGVRKAAAGKWVEIGVFMSWGPKSAIEKAQRQGWSREARAAKYRATRLDCVAK